MLSRCCRMSAAASRPGPVLGARGRLAPAAVSPRFSASPFLDGPSAVFVRRARPSLSHKRPLWALAAAAAKVADLVFLDRSRDRPRRPCSSVRATRRRTAGAGLPRARKAAAALEASSRSGTAGTRHRVGTHNRNGLGGGRRVTPCGTGGPVPRPRTPRVVASGAGAELQAAPGRHGARGFRPAPTSRPAARPPAREFRRRTASAQSGLRGRRRDRRATGRERPGSPRRHIGGR